MDLTSGILDTIQNGINQWMPYVFQIIIGIIIIVFIIFFWAIISGIEPPPK